MVVMLLALKVTDRVVMVVFVIVGDGVSCVGGIGVVMVLLVLLMISATPLTSTPSILPPSISSTILTIP